ncbi:MAG: hypothetical protein M9932_04620 [Xanthobacteraceae bacterium]|nr:hypothetical protein [Xanthobacteraceae bacterium]
MGPFIRIGLRYLGGYLAARGWLAQSEAGLFDDPDLVAAVSFAGAALCALAGEGWYWLARRFGWAK